jgi:maltose alpha-D-glucosyltransferase/alpha-amylase
VFGVGAYVDLHASDPSVFAFARILGERVVVCIYNLSRFVHAAAVDLSAWEGRRSYELEGGAALAEIGPEPAQFTLTQHAYIWLELRAPQEFEGRA